MPCGYTYALYSMTTTPDQQLIDYKELLATHVTPEFVKVKFFEYECEKNEFRIDER